MSKNISHNYYYYNGFILPLYPVLCCFKRDFYSVSSGSRDTSVLLSLLLYSFSPFQMIDISNSENYYFHAVRDNGISQHHEVTNEGPSETPCTITALS